MIRTKRVYDPPSEDDGLRVLVDRLWPRGLSRERAHLDQWLRELAPSTPLRKWFGHDPTRWDEFTALYHTELRDPAVSDGLDELASAAWSGSVTLLFAAKNEAHNNAVALKAFLESRR